MIKHFFWGIRLGIKLSLLLAYPAALLVIKYGPASSALFDLRLGAGGLLCTLLGLFYLAVKHKERSGQRDDRA